VLITRHAVPAAVPAVPQGVLRMGQEIEVRPGVVTKDASGAIKCIPIRSRIVSLFAEQNPLQFAVPGGLIGVGTTVDPTLTRADRLVGQVLGEVGALPDVFTELEINFFLLRRLLGVRTSGDEKQGKVCAAVAAGEAVLGLWQRAGHGRAGRARVKSWALLWWGLSFDQGAAGQEGCGRLSLPALALLAQRARAWRTRTPFLLAY